MTEGSGKISKPTVINGESPFNLEAVRIIPISATTEVFNEPQDKTQFRYLHHADFPVKNGLYSYYVGTEYEQTGKFEFEGQFLKYSICRISYGPYN